MMQNSEIDHTMRTSSRGIMTWTSSSLVRCFQEDVMELSMAMAIDFGFVGLATEELWAFWFALLKDFWDHLRHSCDTEDAAVLMLHQTVVSGTLRMAVESAADLYNAQSWPRYYENPERTSSVLASVHQSTAVQRFIAENPNSPEDLSAMEECT